MSFPLALARHVLVLLPAAATMFLSDIRPYAYYIFFLLAGLLIIRWIELQPRLAFWLLPVELLFFALLAHHYGGLMALTLFSGVIAGFSYLSGRGRITGLLLTASAALLFAIRNLESDMAAFIIVAWLMAILLLAAHAAKARKQTLADALYDELARSHEELRQARLRLLNYAAQVEQTAQADERNRIAKEIHDDLGHRLIRMKMMMEAVMRLFDGDPPRAREMLEQIRGQLEESMDNMRRTVRRLSPEETGETRHYALDRLIHSAGRDLGIRVGMEIHGRPHPLYPSVEYALYRNAQEAITNAVRHGAATEVAITLDYSGNEFRMTVSNNGSVPEGPISKGLGLKGMNERIELLGGKLSVEIAGRFAVETTLPLGTTALAVPERQVMNE